MVGAVDVWYSGRPASGLVVGRARGARWEFRADIPLRLVWAHHGIASFITVDRIAPTVFVLYLRNLKDIENEREKEIVSAVVCQPLSVVRKMMEIHCRGMVSIWPNYRPSFLVIKGVHKKPT